MNKYVLAMVVLGFLGFHGFQKLRQSYHSLNESASNHTSSETLVRSLEEDPLKTPADNPAEIIYYLNVDRFADGDKSNNASMQKTNPLGFHGGDLKGLIQNFDYIKSLGVSAVLLDPLTQQNDEARTYKDKSGASYEHHPFSGFYQDNPSAIDPRFGTLDDLMELTKVAKAAKIKTFMLLDLRFVMPGSPLLQDPKTAKLFLPKDIPLCNPKQKVMRDCSYGGRRTFDHNNPETVKYLTDLVTEKWARYGLDGVFLKWASFYDPRFVIDLRKTLRAKYGKAFKLVSQSVIKEGAFHHIKVTDYRFHKGFPDAIINLVLGDADSKAMLTYLQSIFYPQKDQLNIAPLKNDFRPSLPYLFSDDLRLYTTSFALILASGGSPIINFGEEVGKIDSGMPLYKTDFPWGDQLIAPGAGLKQDEWALKEYKRLISLRKSRPKMFSGMMRAIEGDFPEKSFCFELVDGKTINSLSCFNFSASSNNFSVSLPDNWKGATSIKDHLNGKKIEVINGQLSLSAMGYGAVILAP